MTDSKNMQKEVLSGSASRRPAGIDAGRINICLEEKNA